MAFPSRRTENVDRASSPFKAPARLQAASAGGSARPADNRTADPLEIKVTVKSAGAPTSMPASPQRTTGQTAAHTQAPVPAPVEMVPGPADDYSDDDYTSLDGIDPLGMDDPVTEPGFGRQLPDLQPAGMSSAVPAPVTPDQPMEEGLDESEFLPTVRNASLAPVLGEAQAADYSVPVGDVGRVGGESESPKKRGSLFSRGSKKAGKKKASSASTAPQESSPVIVPAAPSVPKPANDVSLPGLPTESVNDSAGGEDSDRSTGRRRHGNHRTKRGKTAIQDVGVSVPASLGLAVSAAGAVLSVPLLAQAVSTMVGVSGIVMFLGLSALVIVVSLALGFVSLRKSTTAGAVTIILALLMAVSVVGYVYTGSKEPMPLTASSEPTMAESSGDNAE